MIVQEKGFGSPKVDRVIYRYLLSKIGCPERSSASRSVSTRRNESITP